MLVTERDWIIKNLETIMPYVNTVIDVGSGEKQSNPLYSTLYKIFKPVRVYDYLRNKKIELKTLDFNPKTGASYICDVLKNLPTELSNLEFDLVLCNNLLEHVSDIEKTRDNLLSLLGKYLLVTVPYKFPYHPIPIDNNYRPSSDDLVNLFSQLRLITAETFEAKRDNILHRFTMLHHLPQVTGGLFMRI